MTVNAILGRARDLARSEWKGVAARWCRTPTAGTNVLLGCMIVGGVVLRIQGIGLPYEHTFDESQYVDPAHHYLLGVEDLSDGHPPLSKLLIAVGMLLCGHNPLGWRFISLCFGIQSIVLAFWLASSLFEDRRAGWLAAAFVAADGFFISYSRTGLPDGVLNCLVLWSMLAAVSARGWRGVLAAGVLVGAAASIKWSGLMVGLPACLAVLLLKRAPWYSIASFAVVPVVHGAVWVVGLKVMKQPSDLKSIWEVVHRLLKIHLDFPHNTNPLASSWYTWPVLYHPIVVKFSNWGGKVRFASAVGNPLLWLTAGLSVAGLPLVGSAMAVRARWRQRWIRWFDVRFSKALAILLVGWVSMLLPSISGKVCTYWYHYMPSWSFAVLLLAGVVARLERRYPQVVLVFVLLVLAVSVYFAPVWGELPLSLPAVHRRLIFLPWRE